MLSFITAMWEWCLLALYVIEKAIKLSPSKKDDLIWDMVLMTLLEMVNPRDGNTPSFLVDKN